MQGKRVAFVGAISGLIVMASGAVGFGLGRGTDTPEAPAVAQGQADATLSGGSSGSVGSAPGSIEPAVGIAGDRAVGAFPGPDFPGLPPYPGQGPTGDGLHAVGVAYKQTGDADAKPGPELVKQAFADAVKQAQELAEASGVKLGRLLSVSDIRQTQPWYEPCGADPATGVAEDKGSDTPTILPAPAPPCDPSYHVMAWVFVRYEIAQ